MLKILSAPCYFLQLEDGCPWTCTPETTPSKIVLFGAVVLALPLKKPFENRILTFLCLQKSYILCKRYKEGNYLHTNKMLAQKTDYQTFDSARTRLCGFCSLCDWFVWLWLVLDHQGEKLNWKTFSLETSYDHKKKVFSSNRSWKQYHLSLVLSVLVDVLHWAENLNLLTNFDSIGISESLRNLQLQVCCGTCGQSGWCW